MDLSDALFAFTSDAGAEASLAGAKLPPMREFFPFIKDRTLDKDDDKDEPFGIGFDFEDSAAEHEPQPEEAFAKLVDIIFGSPP